MERGRAGYGALLVRISDPLSHILHCAGKEEEEEEEEKGEEEEERGCSACESHTRGC